MQSATAPNQKLEAAADFKTVPGFPHLAVLQYIFLQQGPLFWILWTSLYPNTARQTVNPISFLEQS